MMHGLAMPVMKRRSRNSSLQGVGILLQLFFVRAVRKVKTLKKYHQMLIIRALQRCAFLCFCGKINTIETASLFM